MLLTEADGKALFAEYGIEVPRGVLLSEPVASGLPGAGPWIVKAQVPVGGRGKAGGVLRCESPAQVQAALRQLLGSRLKGHAVETCLVEQAVAGDERYLAVMVAAADYGLRAIYGHQGGIDIEQSDAPAGRPCAADIDAVAAAFAELTADEPRQQAQALVATGRKLAALLLERELALAEINPLFVSAAGCVAGDAKVAVDLNAVDRQPRIAALVAQRPAVYGDADRKLREDFDYVELDPQGEIGLVTTGAGLSMMLIDELTARGGKPLNFCDIRTGQMRGSPARLMRVLEWITSRSSLRVVLVNIFAGITDLAEFATLLAAAVEGTPSLRVPVVARLVGRGAVEAKRILSQRRPDIVVTEDLEALLGQVVGTANRAKPAIHPVLGPLRGQSRQGEGESSGPIPTILSAVSRATPVIVQGITGRMGRTHAALMRGYGTNIVGGTSARPDATEAAGVPVFANCAAAVAATGAVASVAMAPAEETLDAVLEAIAAGIKLIVTVAEGIPQHDALRIGSAIRDAGAVWIGGSTPGLAIPGEIKLGFLPDVALLPGPLAIMTKSGTLSYEVGYRLARHGIGQSMWVGVGGDPVKGVRFADLLPAFFADPRTAGVILVGEVGGTEEEECADALLQLGLRKPVYALIAGREAKEGVAMGHAGALVHGDSGTLATKTRRLMAAGARCFGSVEGLVQACATDFRVSGD
ncbi:MAG TPA: ATP-grasp domain-containing protein [Acetobacteraceae bacterium]|nr:ATP-grasp domain-containing protein [Acetobacteraceae bacterium]